ncbi:hypothetical protein NKDENANG_00457 [Candidatus Entotheonellaceae bacterium PAL068K]
MRLDLIAGCLLSVSVHASFFFLVPAPSVQSLSPSESPTEAELVVLEVPVPTARQSPAPSPAPQLDAAAQPVSVASTFDVTKIGALDLQQINGAVEKMSAGASAQLPLSPPLQLPTQSQFDTAQLPLAPLPRQLPAVTTSLLEQSLRAPGVATGVDKQVGWGHVRLGEKQRPSRIGLPKLARGVVPRALSPPLLASLPPVSASLGIQGPAAKREPLSRPSLPKVKVQIESEIMLKFWVRPDGVVSRVLPERKGDAALEAVAIRYLEGWRFTPLPAYEPQVEQWGLITVRFLLKGR